MLDSEVLNGLHRVSLYWPTRFMMYFTIHKEGTAELESFIFVTATR
jgi:hypothetical protein